jgi:hypothetical protein
MTTRTRTWRRTLAGLALAFTTTAAVAACSGGLDAGGDAGAGGGETASSASGATDDMPREREAPAAAAADEAAQRSTVATRAPAAEPGSTEKKIARGTVALEADDVTDARAEVQRIADSHGGQVAESQTETDSDGVVTHSRMVLRVPVAEFAAAMDELEQVAALRSSDQDTDVVTAKYADLEARVRAQEASLRRVELLFSRAQSIRDIVAIEAQLTSRQADLDSLTGQLRVLEDRTALSTITVHLSDKDTKEPRDDDTAGFLAGLAAGWDTMKGLGTGIATVSGALLPFVVLAALLGVPLAIGVRRLRRRPAQTAAPAAATGEAG